jgi:hypothetical protein
LVSGRYIISEEARLTLLTCSGIFGPVKQNGGKERCEYFHSGGAMTSLLVCLGIAAVCIAALRIAGPEHYSPRCCMGLALQAIKDAEEKGKGAAPQEAPDLPAEPSGKA